MEKGNNIAKWILRFRAKDRQNFQEIRDGLKSVETRAGTPKYRKVKAGDILVFVCGRERLMMKVREVSTFKSIEEMLRVINLKKIMPSLSSKDEMVKIYHGYPRYKEKIKKYGLVAWQLRKARSHQSTPSSLTAPR